MDKKNIILGSIFCFFIGFILLFIWSKKPQKFEFTSVLTAQYKEKPENQFSNRTAIDEAIDSYILNMPEYGNLDRDIKKNGDKILKIVGEREKLGEQCGRNLWNLIKFENKQSINLDNNNQNFKPLNYVAWKSLSEKVFLKISFEKPESFKKFDAEKFSLKVIYNDGRSIDGKCNKYLNNILEVDIPANNLNDISKLIVTVK